MLDEMSFLLAHHQIRGNKKKRIQQYVLFLDKSKYTIVAYYPFSFLFGCGIAISECFC